MMVVVATPVVAAPVPARPVAVVPVAARAVGPVVHLVAVVVVLVAARAARRLVVGLEAEAVLVAPAPGGARSVAIARNSNRRRNGSHRRMHRSPKAKSSFRAAARSRSTHPG